MPLLVRCNELQAGMRLAEAFMWHRRMMLPGGKVLTREDTDILQRKYPNQFLKIGDPVLDSVAEFEDDGREREVAATATQKIAQCMADAGEKISTRAHVGSVNFTSMRSAAAAVVDYIKSNPVSAALLPQHAGGPEGYLSDHAGSVFYLSMVLGSAVRDYVVRERMRQTAASNLSSQIAMDLLPLGLGAMFIDVAMYPLAHIFDAGYELTPDDRKAIREHPNTGAELIPENMPAGVKTIVRAHHEAVDGSGYPLGTTGDHQHVFSRITRICDAYDAGTAEKVYAQAKSPARVIWEMTAGPSRTCYDPVLTKMFASLIQPFPIGAKLKLTDGREAVVVRYNRKQPFSPNVIVAFDDKGERLPREQLTGPVNLGEGNDLRIASFDGEDLSCIYETIAQTERITAEPACSFAAAYP